MQGWNRRGAPIGGRARCPVVVERDRMVRRGPMGPRGQVGRMGRMSWMGWVVAAVTFAALASAPAPAPAADQRRTAKPAAADVTDVAGTAAAADLGVVPAGDEARHTFRLVNDGAAPLTLTPGRLPPGVTLPAFDRTIAPGTSGHVEVALDGFAFAGPTKVEVALTTDDPTR